MKRSFYLFFLLCYTFAIAQNTSNTNDFFVQYNGDLLTKKVSVAEVLNHSLLKEYNSKNNKFSGQEMDAIFKLNDKITIHGNFTDSISYYQITIPIKNKALLKEFLLNKNNSTDSVALAQKVEIIDFNGFSMVRSDTISKKETIAWNDNYLVIYELTNKYNYLDYQQSQTFIEDDIYDQDAPPPPPVPSTEEKEVIYGDPEPTDTIIEVTPDETVAEEDYLEGDITYNKEKNNFDKLQIKDQETHVKSLFENGFTAPHSDKIDIKADISSWINYSSFLESSSKLYSALGVLSAMNGYLPSQYKFGDFVKGINFNAYFETDKLRIEETIEYSEEMAKTMQKITDRKINKRVYSYFPSQKPIGYFSYHINSKELLNSIPSFTSQIFGKDSPFGEDAALVGDLIATLVDEEATASLLDGDFSFFLNDMVQKEIKSKFYEYDDNYEQIEREITIKKSVPLFTMVFTSTHPTFADNLINLGVRKGFLKADGNLYYFTEKMEYGEVFVLKDKDVLVIGNVPGSFNGESNMPFVKDIQNNLKKNALLAAVDFEKIGKAYQKSKEQTVNDEKFVELSRHFNSLQLQAPKKLKDNKFSFEMVLNSTQKDKNIILQFLDAAEKMK